MAQIVWNSLGQRFFEVGLDRGVLYPPNQDGVAWNGMVSFSEKVVGGATKPYYIDGIKYANVNEPEEFGGTLQAYTCPDEFLDFDGYSAVAGGLYASNQRRKEFGLSYRSKVGNDLVGDALGYKIHLVYNALAAPSTRDHATINADVDPMMLSWDITTRPLRAQGFTPTAHLVLDSRKVNPDLMKIVEDGLYGTSSSGGRLPDITDLIESFQQWYPVTIVPDYITGLSPLVPGLGDLNNGHDDGTWIKFPGSRLRPKSTPGLNRLEI